MTSPTSKKPRINRANAQTLHATRVRQTAFTLIEVLLALLIISMLIGAIGFGVVGSSRVEYLNEGSDRIATALRMTRIESARRARRFRFSTDETGAPQILWEPQPLSEPDAFVPFVSSMWATSLPDEWVRIDRIKRDDSDAYIPPTLAQEMSGPGGDGTFDTITFYPDGSSESAEIDLRSTDSRDQRMAVINVDGVNSLFEYRIMTLSEFETYAADRESREAE